MADYAETQKQVAKVVQDLQAETKSLYTAIDLLREMVFRHEDRLNGKNP